MNIGPERERDSKQGEHPRRQCQQMLAMQQTRTSHTNDKVR